MNQCSLLATESYRMKMSNKPDIQMNSSDECFHFLSQDYDHPTWMYKAPFQISHDNRLTVDLSNRISLNEYGNFKDLGKAWG